jgi:hypothetical protein
MEQEMSVLMTDPNQPNTTAEQERWQGFAEIDRAIHENRLMEYRLRKSWADRWERKFTIFVLIIIVAGFTYLAGALAHFW